MISNSEQVILEEICQNSKAALLDIHTIISKVYDDDLALDLNRQAAKYSRLQEIASDNLLKTGIIPVPISILDRMKRWSAIQANTALNISTEHVADMMIKENTTRLGKMLHAVKQNKVINAMTCELAEEFLDFEEKNIRILKSYLSASK